MELPKLKQQLRDPEIYPKNKSTTLLERRSLLDTSTSTNDPDAEYMKQSKTGLEIAETLQKTEKSAEIYPQIYPVNRSIAPLDTRDYLEDSQEIQIQPMQKQPKLSTFEETIIQMFELPENIKQLVPVNSPMPDLSLDLGSVCCLKKSTFWITLQTMTLSKTSI